MEEVDCDAVAEESLLLEPVDSDSDPDSVDESEPGSLPELDADELDADELDAVTLDADELDADELDAVTPMADRMQTHIRS